MPCDTSINNDSDRIDLKSFVAGITTLLILFLIGLYLQIKIIKASIETKGINWKVDLQQHKCHAIELRSHSSKWLSIIS